MLGIMSAGLARRRLKSIGSSYLKLVFTTSISETRSGGSSVWRDGKVSLFSSLCRAKSIDSNVCRDLSAGGRRRNSFGGIRLMSTTPDSVRGRSADQRRCREVTCNTLASYGWEDGAREFCSKHKKKGMESRVTKLCKHHDKCIRFAIYGLPGETTHCRVHKHEGMLNLRFKLCERPACTKYASFGLIVGEPTHCRDHKEKAMQDVVSKRCIEPECKRHRIYGYAGERRLYCKIHKKPNMLDLMHKRCEEPGCDTFAFFGYADDRKKRFCASHKLAGMISLKKRAGRE